MSDTLQAPTKQLIPAVVACMQEMRGYWDKTFHHRVSIKGYSGLEIADGEILGLAELPVVEQLVHFIPTKQPTLTWVGLTLPGETELFTASMYQNVYKSAAQSIKILTWSNCFRT